jgi:hypothetical protein
MGLEYAIISCAVAGQGLFYQVTEYWKQGRLICMEDLTIFSRQARHSTDNEYCRLKASSLVTDRATEETRGK